MKIDMPQIQNKTLFLVGLNGDGQRIKNIGRRKQLLNVIISQKLQNSPASFRDEALLEKCIGGVIDVVGQIRSQFESVFTYKLSWYSSFYLG